MCVCGLLRKAQGSVVDGLRWRWEEKTLAEVVMWVCWLGATPTDWVPIRYQKTGIRNGAMQVEGKRKESLGVICLRQKPSLDGDMDFPFAP